MEGLSKFPFLPAEHESSQSLHLDFWPFMQQQDRRHGCRSRCPVPRPSPHSIWYRLHGCWQIIVQYVTHGFGHSLVFNRWNLYFHLFYKSCFWGEVQVRDGSSVACLSKALPGSLQRSHLHEGTGPLCLGQCFKLQGMWWLSWSSRDTSVNKAEGRKSLHRQLGCKKQKYSTHQALQSSVAVCPVT